jgi:hypothetical protein
VFSARIRIDYDRKPFFFSEGRDVSDLETNTASEESQDAIDDIRPAREGLPPGYRMRADRHYVDELTSDAPRHQPSVPSPQPARSERSPELFASLSEELAAVEAARRLLAGGGLAVARRPALDLIAVHTARATWLINASRLVEAEAPLPDRRRPLGTVIDDLVEQFAPEGRLMGITLRARVDDRAYSTRFDAQTLSVGLMGGLVALLPFVDADDEPVLSLSASRSNASCMVDAVSRSTKLDTMSAERFFDGTWMTRPGGWPAALGARALKRAAEHHGGTVVCEVRPGDVRLRLTLPESGAAR